MGAVYVSEIVLVVIYKTRNAFTYASGETHPLFYPKTEIKKITSN
jgi:hypothetical protein